MEAFSHIICDLGGGARLPHKGEQAEHLRCERAGQTENIQPTKKNTPWNWKRAKRDSALELLMTPCGGSPSFRERKHSLC
jgi:hypothetical protein